MVLTSVPFDYASTTIFSSYFAVRFITFTNRVKNGAFKSVLDKLVFVTYKKHLIQELTL